MSASHLNLQLYWSVNWKVIKQQSLGENCWPRNHHYSRDIDENITRYAVSTGQWRSRFSCSDRLSIRSDFIDGWISFLSKFRALSMEAHSTSRDEIFTGENLMQLGQNCFAYECWPIDCRASRWTEYWSFPSVILWFPFTSRVLCPSGLQSVKFLITKALE